MNEGSPEASPQRQPAILFDLDGTLTDPLEGIARCIEHALQRLGATARSRTEIAACVGPPLRGSFAGFLGTHEAAVIEQAMTYYRERFGVVGLFENEVYTGVPEMLVRLRSLGHRLYVATSKPRVYAEQIVQHFDLARYFTAVYGSELDGRHDDKVELLAYLLERERLQPASTTMVGDRNVDILAARLHGLRSVGVTYGYGTRDELLNAGADALCDDPSAIVALFDERAAASKALSQTDHILDREA